MIKVIKYKYQRFNTWISECPQINLGFIFMDGELYIAYNNICEALGFKEDVIKQFELDTSSISFIISKQDSDMVGIRNASPNGSKFISVPYVVDKLYEHSSNLNEKNIIDCIINILNAEFKNRYNTYTYNTIYKVDINMMNDAHSKINNVIEINSSMDEKTWAEEILDIGKKVKVVSNIDNFIEISNLPILNKHNTVSVRIVLYNGTYYFSIADISKLCNMSNYIVYKIRTHSPTIKVNRDDLLNSNFSFINNKGMNFIPQYLISSYIEHNKAYTEEDKKELINFINMDFTEAKLPSAEIKINRANVTKSKDSIVESSIANVKVTDLKLINVDGHSIRVGKVNDVIYVLAMDIFSAFYYKKDHFSMAQFMTTSGCDKSHFISVTNQNLADCNIWQSPSERGSTMMDLDATLSFIKRWKHTKTKSTSISKTILEALDEAYKSTLTNNSSNIETVSHDDIVISEMPNTSDTPSVDTNITESINALLTSTYATKMEAIDCKYKLIKKLCDSLGEDLKLLKECAF